MREGDGSEDLTEHVESCEDVGETYRHQQALLKRPKLADRRQDLPEVYHDDHWASISGGSSLKHLRRGSSLRSEINF